MSSSTTPTTGNNTAPPTEVERIAATMRQTITDNGADHAYVYAMTLIRTLPAGLTDAEHRARVADIVAGMDRAFADLAREQDERIAALVAERSGVAR
ncbi:hypothetical protein O7626_40805 [Micromonospora sp. WMMD1102]|uniref:hypothetical protein n=1 Tax=Micromonospora sp. WMMD1102 TaxID=3016105 RepID=UPI0024154338|nr:hypothetical protein [Micromonospora sp. WMMD1102]MDG4790342.1 hypothetical protein [Micromonospora sp. WMMD1102]MDG4792145.1 hypothetical protein [Micromonospora sp. WMMD1102]